MNPPFTIHDGARFRVRAYPAQSAIAVDDRAGHVRLLAGDDAILMARLLGELVARRADLDASIRRALTLNAKWERDAALLRIKQRMERAETGAEHAALCLEAARLLEEEAAP